MDAHKSHSQTLNYFEQSPVRGQLEPTDGTTGDRRFLQCKDTPNELKVLLPAKTSILYGKLLSAELVELKKGSAASWDRIKDIRRLKERMIRKCERLARASIAEKHTGQMLTLYAPPDFRLREMERWLKYQSSSPPPAAFSCCSMCGPLGVPPTTGHPVPSTKHVSRGVAVVATRTALTAEDLKPLSRNVSLRSTPASKPAKADIVRSSSTRTTSSPGKRPSGAPDRVPKRPSASSTPTLVDPASEIRYYLAKHGSKDQISRVEAYMRLGKVSAIPAVVRQADPPPKPIPYRERPSAHTHRSVTSRLEETRRALMQSPDPIPIPYRPRGHHEDEPHRHDHDHDYNHEAEQAVFAKGPLTASPPAGLETAKVLPEQEPPKVPSPGSTLVDVPQDAGGQDRDGAAVAPTTGMPLETIHEKPGEHEHEDVVAQHPLLHRRSSLKRKGSMHSLASQAKSVTWAMDRDWTEQTSKFIKVSNEAEVAAYELEQNRAQYHDEVAMMRIVCQDVVKAAERLGLDTDELKHEHTALALQQHKVMTITDSLEQLESRYKDAVLAVLEETKHVVQLCDKKRETHDC